MHSSGPPLHHHPKTLELLPVTCMNAGTVEVESYVKPEQMTVGCGYPSCNKSLHRAFECFGFFHKLKIHLDAFSLYCAR